LILNKGGNILKRKSVFITSLLLFLFIFSTTVLAVDPVVQQENASKFGIFTLIPPLIAIILAFITKNVVLSLFIGVFSGAFLLNLNGLNIFSGVFYGFLRVIEEILGSLADPWNAGIILQCLAIGGMIALITKMGGAKAIAESLSKKAKTKTSAQLITWFLGICVFFDDYANSLIVGPIMRPITDKMKISREKLSFIVDATAAPIAGIALISTWVGYELGLIKDGFESIDAFQGVTIKPYNIFIETIPYRFYNILILVFIVCTAVMLREFGPMLTAERRARETGKVLRDGAKPMISDESTDLQPVEGINLKVSNALVPILVLVVGAFAGFYYNGYVAISGGEDTALIELLRANPSSFGAIRECFGASDAAIVLFQAALLSGIVAMIMGVSQKIFTVSEAIDTWVSGMKSLLITGVILLLAWSLSGVIKELGTAVYLVEKVLAINFPAFLLPSLIFILGSIISFATGTSYGTMGILMPLTIPLAYALDPTHSFVVVAISAVLTGAIFGDHCSPISDTTILSSMGAAADHLDHVKTQLYYALVVAGVAVIFGYIPAGLGMPVWLVLPIDIVIIGLIVRFVGKKVEA
jgi:Na+/H+ antiporter NhaC